MEKQTISFFQLSLILFGGIGVLNHVIVLPFVLDCAHRDAWISILLAGFFYLCWIPLLYYIHKKTSGQNIYEWLKKNFGKAITSCLFFLIGIYSLLMCIITVKDTLTFLHFYYPETPKIILAMFILIVCFYNASKGIKSIAMTAGVLLPIVILLGFFVMSFNFQYKNFTLLKPFLENGLPSVLQGMIYPGVGYIELIFVLFFQHHLQTKTKLYQLFLVGFCLILLTLGPTIGSITEFGPVVSSLQRYPAFQEWRIVSIGRYIDHMDFFAIYQWFVGTFVRLSILVLLISDLWKFKTIKGRNSFIFSLLGIIILLGTYLPMSDHVFYELLFHYVFPIFFGLTFMISLVLWLLTMFASRKRRLHHEKIKR
ncbi:spore germination protein (amino acid permease) [Seinonella peptonophila]|uniref:Spore germination protein (Amino acid permease) n=1 Tax=Seinonella peptonophila TaxID=112248 RepID=A0A1M5BAS1_9BACL|nr:endospore germination permease [Seinonella peptonophila]SHF39427.1 spore germination protein (amino acid permease) [Seinonella peptonophila]